jgi:hypothetical protein
MKSGVPTTDLAFEIMLPICADTPKSAAEIVRDDIASRSRERKRGRGASSEGDRSTDLRLHGIREKDVRSLQVAVYDAL